MHYDTWLTTNPSEYLDAGDEMVSIDELTKYVDAKEWMEELLHATYRTGNVQDFENALDELSRVWGLSLPSGEMRVQERRDDWFDAAKAICGGKK